MVWRIVPQPHPQDRNQVADAEGTSQRAAPEGRHNRPALSWVNSRAPV